MMTNPRVKAVNWKIHNQSKIAEIQKMITNCNKINTGKILVGNKRNQIESIKISMRVILDQIHQQMHWTVQILVINLTKNLTQLHLIVKDL